MNRSIIDRYILPAMVLLILLVLGCGVAPTIRPESTGAQSQIVFSSSRALDGSDTQNGTSNIWIVNADGTDAEPLTRLTAHGAGSSSPVWSPDGTKIAFQSMRALDGSDAAIPSDHGTVNIWIMNFDGTDAKPLTKVTADFINSVGPRWSPRGDKILFTSTQPLESSGAASASPPAWHAANIWVVNADGTGAKHLTTLTRVSSNYPNWSPDGTKVLYVSRRALDLTDSDSLTGNIWQMNADGTDDKPLTMHTAATNYDGTWSPDGKKIAYVSMQALDGSDTAGTENVWTMNSDGGDELPLTKSSGIYVAALEPVWSPDGTKIAFTSSLAPDGSESTDAEWRTIWVMNADGTDAKALIKSTRALSIMPAWSPDGTRIVFASRRALDGSDAENANGTWNIWVVNADGSAARPLTKNTTLFADSFVPQWHP